MRLAFYAPMKPPDHPVPSGDRRMARLLMRALEAAGHELEVACHLRSWQADPDPVRQDKLREQGRAEAALVTARFRARPAEARPAAWLTYHLYYKAPDWVGPEVARALQIPYLVAEASVAPKRAGGPWDPGHRATLAALAQAAAVITLNPADSECLPEGTPIEDLPPFLDAGPFLAANARRAEHRGSLAAMLGLDPQRSWLLAVGMMRPGDKLASYRFLAQALVALQELSWTLIIVGDGPAQADVKAAFATIEPDRLVWLGEQAPQALVPLYAACDLMIWPAINEAYGMALLEAQASGLPVLAGRVGGVPAIVGNGGVLTAPGDVAAFVEGGRRLLQDPDLRQRLAQTAIGQVRARHDLPAAAQRLDAILREAVAMTAAANGSQP